jgi:hypothetical protein
MGFTQKLLLSISNSLSENFLQPRKINTFIKNESTILFRQMEEKGIENFSATDTEKIIRICHRLPKLGLDLTLPNFKEDFSVGISSEERTTWQAALEDGRVIHKGILQFQSAGMLLDILESSHKKSTFLDENMGWLLRHVEVKREKALLQYSELVSTAKCWEERCTYVVLFSSYAYLKKDWRFINAALKLTEWLWKEYQRPFSNLSSLALLAALVEQEFALREMQSC